MEDLLPLGERQWQTHGMVVVGREHHRQKLEGQKIGLAHPNQLLYMFA